MKTKIFYLAALYSIFVLASCDKTQTFNDQWKINNEQAFDLTAANPAYKHITSQSKAGDIVYKVLQSGTGTVSPIFTDNVKVNYTGYYKKDWTKGDTYTDSDGNLVRNKTIFDSTQDRGPAEFPVGGVGVIDGFTTALQHMKVGDKWEVWIPWKMGYGETGTQNGTIPPYTTLVFEMELVEIMK